MVLQKTVDNLKARPRDERKAIAGGIAIGMAAILFFGWGFFFFKKIQGGGADVQLGGGQQEQFLPFSVREAQEELQRGFSDFDELRGVPADGSSGL